MKFSDRATANLSLGGLAVMCLLALVGCTRTLDFRNAEISEGKIYSRGENSGFSGKLTNVPIGKIPVASIKPLLDLLTTVTKDESFRGIFLANAIGSILGNTDAGPRCDVSAKNGRLHGEAVCSVSDAPFLSLTYAEGVIDGPVVFLKPSEKGAKVAEATFNDGLMTGASQVFDAKTGKTLHTVSWTKGLATGPEQMFDSAGNLTFKATFVDGKYEGEVVQYGPGGAVVAKSTYRAGVLQAPQRSSSSGGIEGCVTKYIDAFRKEAGDEAVISVDQQEEWRGWCEQGKEPA